MPGPFLIRDLGELYVQLEAVFGTSPGALAGGDAFKHRSGFFGKKVVARYDRDRDRDLGQASVLSTQKGREKASFSIVSDLIPSGNGTTPTEPDMDVLFQAHFGTKHKATANTTTGAGSVGTAINLTAGGGAASGILAGDIIMVDVSTAVGYEARQVISITVDALVIDRAFTVDPAASRTVKVGTTYRLSSSLLQTVHLWQFLADATTFRHKIGGALPADLDINVDFSNDTPVSEVTISGEGQQLTVATTSRPTPVTAGSPNLPSQSKVFIGASGVLCVVSAGLKSNNGGELRENEACTLFPSGAKRTGNGSRFMITQTLQMHLLTGAIEGYYDNASSLTAYDVIVQLGITPGNTVVWRTPKFIPSSPDIPEQDGEVDVALEGRCYGTTADDEVALAFL